LATDKESASNQSTPLLVLICIADQDPSKIAFLRTSTQNSAYILDDTAQKSLGFVISIS